MNRKQHREHIKSMLEMKKLDGRLYVLLNEKLYDGGFNVDYYKYYELYLKTGWGIDANELEKNRTRIGGKFASDILYSIIFQGDTFKEIYNGIKEVREKL